LNGTSDDTEDQGETECGTATDNEDLSEGDDDSSSCCGAPTPDDDNSASDPFVLGEDDGSSEDDRQTCHGVPEFSSVSLAVLFLALPLVFIVKRRFHIAGNALPDGSIGQAAL
jgi:hypothetical protein